MGQEGLVLWGGVICCVAFAITVVTPWWPVAMACTVVLGFSFYMLHNTVQIKATEMAPQARGAAVAIYASSWSLGQAFGVAVMGARGESAKLWRQPGMTLEKVKQDRHREADNAAKLLGGDKRSARAEKRVGYQIV